MIALVQQPNHMPSPMNALDYVEAIADSRPLDLVQLVWDNPHFLFCPEGRPYVNPHGIVYCGREGDNIRGIASIPGCGSSIGSLSDKADFLCSKCDCPKTAHSYNEGRCLMCGHECNLIIGGR